MSTKVEELLSENQSLKNRLSNMSDALDAIEIFASKVAGEAKWWTEVWDAHQAVIDGHIGSIEQYKKYLTSQFTGFHQ